MNNVREFFLPARHVSWFGYLRQFEDTPPFGVLFVCPSRLNVPVRALPFSDFRCSSKQPVSIGCLNG